MVIMNKNIVLIGFMASGKTFVSRELAKRLNRERVSTDEVIEAREKRSISEVFAQSGEPYFRKLEKQVVHDIIGRKNLVIDCGGGVVMNEENLNALKASGIVFFLEASPESIHRRTKGLKGRPLLNVENPLEKIKELLALRDPHYRKAHHVVDSNSDNIGKVVDDILNILSKL
jgi:shikimate kinase